jgi:hypothetical protein
LEKQGIIVATGQWVDECSRELRIVPVNENVIFSPLPPKPMEGMSKYYISITGYPIVERSDILYLIESKL